MGSRILIVLGVILAGFLSEDVSAQARGTGRAPRISSGQNPASPAAPFAPAPGRPGRAFRPIQAPPSQPLPVPFAGTVVDPILRGTSPDVLNRLSSGRDVFRARRGTYGRLSALRGSPFLGAFGYSVYGDSGYLPYATTVPEEPVEMRDGRLSLSVSPSSAQVFVDGLYVGAVSDFQDRGLWLDPGPRRIELRADGHETVTFDVRITEDETVNYRRDLARAAPQPEASRPAATPKTFYVIPGCYAGDTKPSESRLPKGCSPKNVRTIPPVLSRLTPTAGPETKTRPTLQ